MELFSLKHGEDSSCQLLTVSSEVFSTNKILGQSYIVASFLISKRPATQYFLCDFPCHKLIMGETLRTSLWCNFFKGKSKSIRVV